MKWSIDDFNLDDKTNRLIWETSPRILKKIHGLAHASTNTPKFTGQVGVQQAMIGVDGFDKEPLPLVPDLVGKDTVENPTRAVLILGSSYAPFVQDISTRNAIRSSDYRAVRSAAQFQQLFFNTVIVGDTYYYGKLESRFDQIRCPRELIVTDLCHGSFCLRGKQRLRRDMGGDRVVNGSHPELEIRQLAGEARSLFSHYVDAESAWTWQRIQSVKDIVALGAIAEHGILRLFHKMKTQGISMNVSGQPWNNRFQDHEHGWISQHAEPDKTLSFWLEPDVWWNASIGNRNWRILPTYHPAACRRENSWRENLVCKKLKQFLTG
jgi:hypothetical protein